MIPLETRPTQYSPKQFTTFLPLKLTPKLSTWNLELLPMLLGKTSLSIQSKELCWVSKCLVSIFRSASNDRIRGHNFLDRKQPGRRTGLICLMASSNRLMINPHRMVLLALAGMKESTAKKWVALVKLHERFLNSNRKGSFLFFYRIWAILKNLRELCSSEGIWNVN